MTYIITGRAGDAKLARCQIAAQKVQQTCTMVFHRVESKHPSDWEAFLESLVRQQDFVQYRGHEGPLYWTVDGCHVGTDEDFVHMCQETYGIGDVPIDEACHALAHKMLLDASAAIKRKAEGKTFSERVADVAKDAFSPCTDWDVTSSVQHGMRAELRISKQLNEFDIDVPCVKVDGGVVDATAVLHPNGVTKGHCVIVPTADIDNVQAENVVRVNRPDNPSTYLGKNLNANVCNAVLELNGVAFLTLAEGVQGVDAHFQVVPNWQQFPFAPMYDRAGLSTGAAAIQKLPGVKANTAEELLNKVHGVVSTAEGPCVVAFSSDWALVATYNDAPGAPHPVALLGHVNRSFEEAQWPETAGFKNMENQGRLLDPFKVIEHYFPNFPDLAGYAKV